MSVGWDGTGNKGTWRQDEVRWGAETGALETRRWKGTSTQKLYLTIGEYAPNALRISPHASQTFSRVSAPITFIRGQCAELSLHGGAE